MKKILILIGSLIVLVALLFALLGATRIAKQAKPLQVKPLSMTIQGSIYQYFGNEVSHDFNNDGIADRAYIVTQQPGGSGTFFYVVVELGATSTKTTANEPTLPIFSELYLLGDRIAPQTTEIGGVNKNILIVNYADRKLTDSFAVAPSEGKTVQLILDPKTMRFGIVTNNFEGEANPAQMTLSQQKWNWVSTTYNDGTVITPRVANRFGVTFKESAIDTGTVSISTDCNSMSGEYVVNGSSITFSKMISTMMACQDSQEQDFAKGLAEVSGFHFTSNGELVFDLKMDSGVMLFK